MAKVQLDSMDGQHTQQAAAAAKINAQIIEQNGPAGGNALIELEGTPEQLQAFLAAQGYDHTLHTIYA